MRVMDRERLSGREDQRQVALRSDGGHDHREVVGPDRAPLDVMRTALHASAARDLLPFV